MRKHFWAAALAGLLLTGTISAKAWGPTGHRVVAEIAGFHLSQKARAGISAIIGNETLAMIANWPDFIKSDPSYNYLSPWHYINFKEGLTEQQVQ